MNELRLIINNPTTQLFMRDQLVHLVHRYITGNRSLNNFNFKIDIMFETTFGNQDQFFKIMEVGSFGPYKKNFNQFLSYFEYMKQLFHVQRRYKDFQLNVA